MALVILSPNSVHGQGGQPEGFVALSYYAWMKRDADEGEQGFLFGVSVDRSWSDSRINRHVSDEVKSYVQANYAPGEEVDVFLFPVSRD